MISIIEKLIDEWGLSRAEFLSNLNISSSSFTDWKNGKSSPSVPKLIEIANYFNCSIDYLLGRTQIRALKTSKTKEA